MTCRASVSSAYQMGMSRASHCGLILDRYLKSIDDDASKRDLFSIATKCVSQAATLYGTHFSKHKNLLSQYFHTIFFNVRSRSRLIIGLGNDSVLETGITLHHVFGTPIIPGTAIKGLASHFCHSVWGESDARFQTGNEFHELIFGTTDNAGSIVFHDSWITPKSLLNSLSIDIMTPHHTDYYSDTNQNSLPTDFDDPIPVPFLSVHGEFEVPLTSRTNDANSVQWITLTRCLIESALAEWGIGGKTSSGYGIMAPVGNTKTSIIGPVPPTEPTTSPKSTYQKGQLHSFKRIEDPKGRGRTFFETADEKKMKAILVAGESDPGVPLGGTISLYIRAISESCLTVSAKLQD